MTFSSYFLASIRFFGVLPILDSWGAIAPHAPGLTYANTVKSRKPALGLAVEKAKRRL